MVVLIATFFAKQRDLIHATAVCRRWRTTLLSSPRLWCNVGGSSSEIQAYMERSGSMPIVVNISSPGLAEFVAPHTSRLVGLALRVDKSKSSFKQIAEHLRHPIPTLHTLRISNGGPKLRAVEFALDVRNAFFIHSKNLELDGILSLRGPQVVPDSFKPFPHVTELALRVDERDAMKIPDLLDTLERFPVLERVSITLGSSWWPGPPKTIILPHVQEVTILAFGQYIAMPPIFGHIKLPNLTLLRLQGLSPTWGADHPIFPTKPFGEYLPSLADLPELQVSINTSIEFAFRNPQAVFSHVVTRPFKIQRCGTIWGTLPLHTVRRLVVDIQDPRESVNDGWFVGLLRDLVNLEHLGFGGESAAMVRRMCQEVEGRGLHVPIETLVSQAAEEYLGRGAQL